MNSETDRFYVLPMSRDPTLSDDETTGCYCGSRWINCNTNTAFTCCNSAKGAAIWRQTTNPSSQFQIITAPFETESRKYEFAHAIPYIGTNTAPLLEIRIVANSSARKDKAYFDVKIVDALSSKVIAEATNLYSPTKAIFPLTVSNLSETETIFEIYVRCGDGEEDGKANLYSLMYIF